MLVFGRVLWIFWWIFCGFSEECFGFFDGRKWIFWKSALDFLLGIIQIPDSAGRPGREASRNPIHSGFVDTLWSGTSTPSETVNFHFNRSSDFDVTLSYVTDFPNTRQALRFLVFHDFRKSPKKFLKKGGTGWCLHLWLIDFKRGHFWSSLRIMRQTTKAHWACRDPQILFAKSDYFPKEKQKRPGFPWFCFASLNVKSASRN